MGEGWRQSRKEEDDGFEEGDEVDDSLRLTFCCELRAAGVDLGTRGSAWECFGSAMGALAGAPGRLGSLGGAS